MGYIESGREQGAELLAGGETTLGDSGGYFVAPTLFSTTSDDVKIVREEIFGPVLVASPYDSLEEVAERANASEYGLAAGVWTRESEQRPQARRDAARRAWSTSTRGATSSLRRRSAASRPRASAASTVTTASTPTWRPRPSGLRCEPRGVVNVAAQSELPLTRTRTAQWAPALAAGCALLLLAATAEIVLDGAVGHSPLIPKSPQIAGWLAGLGERLGFRVFLIAVLAFTAGYAGLLALARAISKRWAIALIAALHAIVFVGPILLSTDVFSYIAYARMGVEHGLNPYMHGPIAISHDPIYHYVGPDWKHVATAYGPIYTLHLLPVRAARRGRRGLGHEAARDARERGHARC